MSNRLARETSPYLRQHADNPVDWHAWNGDALDTARSANKPILLSIGYSACHWCHVMAHESFEDDETAALMNQLYVNIKVDREERPDLDKIYQMAHQLLTGRGGGWPLTCFLTPDRQLPIFIGTYFPRESRFGLPSFKEVLIQVERYFRDHPDDIESTGTLLRESLERTTDAGATDTALSDAPIRAACERLMGGFDAEHGGFGGAPKFPRPYALELMLEQSAIVARQISAGQDKNMAPAEPAATASEAATANLDAQHNAKAIGQAITLTLDRMALGGLYDQLGGGFYRYCVDHAWAIPHFEKMLYDNAALLALYSDAWVATGNTLYRRIANETADWVMRTMQDQHGGYYSTLDADSEGEEGKFYLWTGDEFDATLSGSEAALAKRVFGLDRPPNFEGRAWHLHRAMSPDAAAATLGVDQHAAQFQNARASLLAERSRRIAPARDEKILVGWNGLTVRAMARASRRLARPDLSNSATQAIDFIHAKLWCNGRLQATYKDAQARLAAYLDDYAFLADGLLELLEVRWRSVDLAFALELTDTVLDHFADPKGGFYFTADDHESLIHRPKTWEDDALPSGNGVMLRVLLKLGSLTGEQRYLDAATNAIKAVMPALARYPDVYATVLLALERYLEPPEIVIVRGAVDELPAWHDLLNADYAPQRYGYCIPDEATGLPGLLAERVAHPNTVAYLCRGTECRLPITDLDTLRIELANTRI